MIVVITDYDDDGNAVQMHLSSNVKKITLHVLFLRV